MTQMNISNNLKGPEKDQKTENCTLKGQGIDFQVSNKKG